jgi:PAT family beta-lactamase induction signal transducer AmpG
MHSLPLYLRPRLLAVLMLGFASGVPLALTGDLLKARLFEQGLSLQTIGLFALVAMPYTFKFLWAPVMDVWRIPLLSAQIGHRRAWLWITQGLVVLAMVGMAVVSPEVSVLATAIAALLLAFTSASQDIVIDAYRVEMLREEEYGAGAAMAVLGYRLGMLMSGGGLLMLADHLPWQGVYLLAVPCVLSASLLSLWIGEPKARRATEERQGIAALLAPYRSFLQRSDWAMLLAFVIAYKLGDAMAGVLTTPFLLDTGFTKTQIGAIVKGFGVFAAIGGSLLGGWAVRRYGMMRTLWVGGIVQMLSNGVYIWQARMGAVPEVLMCVITLENMAGGFGTAAFVAFISHLCNRSYTASHYAALSALASVGRTGFSASAGFIVASVGWEAFFWLSMLVALPGLWMLYRVQRAGFGIQGKPEQTIASEP